MAVEQVPRPPVGHTLRLAGMLGEPLPCPLTHEAAPQPRSLTRGILTRGNRQGCGVCVLETEPPRDMRACPFWSSAETILPVCDTPCLCPTEHRGHSC